jgi:hypothetical protein
VYFALEDGSALRRLYSEFAIGADWGDRLVNFTAGCDVTADPDTAERLLNPDSPTEQLYNAAVCQVSAGNYARAQQLVDAGLTQAGDAMHTHLLTILKTIIVAQTQPEAAAEMFLPLTEAENAIPYVRTVAAANYAALTVDSNVHLARKKMSLFEDTLDPATYRKREIEGFLINRFLILHKIGQPSKLKQVIELAKKAPIDQLIPEVLDRMVDPTTAATTPFSPLVIAQTLINQNKFEEAAVVLTKSSLGRRPRTVAVVCDLYVAAQKPALALDFLKQVEQTRGFLEFAARFAAKHGFPAEASAWADALVGMDRSPKSRALQALVTVERDLEMAERHVSKLPAVSLAGVDLDALEEMPVEPAVAERPQGDGPPSQEVVFEPEVVKKKRRPFSELSPDKQQKRKERKKRRRRLQKPLNYDPARKMDPDRWKPLNKRAGRKKVKKPPQKSSPGQTGRGQPQVQKDGPRQAEKAPPTPPPQKVQPPPQKGKKGRRK